MKKIDHSTATGSLEFTEGNPGTGTPATIVTAQWLNVLQAELINLLVAAGITPDQTGVDRDQVLDAIQFLISATGAPVGSVSLFADDAAPTGYLECDGAAISRTTYAALFAKIGTVFGAGNGTTTFNIPDLRGEFIRGWDHGRGVDTGRSFGSAQDATLIRWALGNTGTGVLVVAGSNTDATVSEIYNPLNPSGMTNPGNTTWNSFKVRSRNVALFPMIKY